jgi:hypothetical protein
LSEDFDIEGGAGTGLSLVTAVTGEILKPEGEFELGRLALRSEYQPIVQKADSISLIMDPVAYEETVQLGRVLQALTKKITDFYKPTKQAFDQAKEVILQYERADLTAVTTAKTSLGEIVLQYDREQERQSAEREKLVKEANAKKEEEERIAAAQAAEAVGDFEGALRILDSQQLTTPVIEQRRAPKKTAGKVSRVKYRGQVDDFSKLIASVAAGETPRLALQVDQKWLDKRADNDREAFSIPGCSVVKTEKAHFRE